MTRKRLNTMYNVNADKVNFLTSSNGLYQYSGKSHNGYYIIKEGDQYSVVYHNSISHFRADLSALEG